MAPGDGGGTLGDLLKWWLKEYVARTSSSRTVTSVVNLRLITTKLAALRLSEVTPGEIERHLQDLADELAPNSLNHLRAYLSAAFSKAKRAGRWNGPNPALEVERRKVPKRLPDFLKPDEVPRVLANLSDDHRPLFAAAIYTGLRKGEKMHEVLLGSDEADVRPIHPLVSHVPVPSLTPGELPPSMALLGHPDAVTTLARLGLGDAFSRRSG